MREIKFRAWDKKSKTKPKKRKIKAWLVRCKMGKARRGIYFWRTVALMYARDYEEVVPVTITMDKK